MNDLYHHGILGQKWGIRRFQNEDGSLTDAGRRFQNEDGSLTDAGRKRYAKEQKRLAKRLFQECKRPLIYTKSYG